MCSLYKKTTTTQGKSGDVIHAGNKTVPENTDSAAGRSSDESHRPGFVRRGRKNGDGAGNVVGGINDLGDDVVLSRRLIQSVDGELVLGVCRTSPQANSGI